MKYLKLIAIFLIILYLSSNAIATGLSNRLKHLSVTTGISTAISGFCIHNINDRWGCFLMGAIPTMIGATAFEAIQEDYTDMENDLIMGAIGAVFGAYVGTTLFKHKRSTIAWIPSKRALRIGYTLRW